MVFLSFLFVYTSVNMGTHNNMGSPPLLFPWRQFIIRRAGNLNFNKVSRKAQGISYSLIFLLESQMVSWKHGKKENE